MGCGENPSKFPNSALCFTAKAARLTTHFFLLIFPLSSRFLCRKSKPRLSFRPNTRRPYGCMGVAIRSYFWGVASHTHRRCKIVVPICRDFWNVRKMSGFSLKIKLPVRFLEEIDRRMSDRWQKGKDESHTPERIKNIIMFFLFILFSKIIIIS